MKKLIFLLTALAAAGSAYGQSTVALDDAIKTGAKDIDAKLAKGAKVVVLNFKAPTERFANYVIEELTFALVSNDKVTVVDRQNLALLQQEMDFQMSGEVSDQSAQEIGAKLGAQSIVSGSFEDMGKYYRIRFRTIAVASAAIQATSSLNVKNDSQVATLLTGAPVGTTAAGADTSVLPNGLNYTTGRKVGAGFLNLIYGVGSFTMGDWVGGLLVGGAELAGIVLLATGSIAADTGELGGGFYAGMGLVFAGSIYGFVRPFSYDKALAKKNGTYYARIEAPHEGFDLRPVVGHNGFSAVQVSYTKRF